MNVAAILAAVIVPSAGPPPMPGDAQLYVRIEDQLLRVEAGAGGDCGAHIPAALHRVVDLRYDLRRLQRYVEGDPEWTRLDREARARRAEQLCITHSVVPLLLRDARRDLAILQLNARRAGYYRNGQRD